MQTFQGRLTDGKSAASTLVKVRFGRAALEMEPARGGEPGPAALESWAYHRLSAQAPLSRKSEDALIGCLDAPGATLFVHDRHFVAALLDKAGQLALHRERWRYMKPALAATAAILLIVGAVFLLDLSPAKSIARLMPDKARELLGTQTLNSMVASKKNCSAAPGRAALDRLLDKLRAATAEDEPFKVTVVEWGLVNAFATAGRHVVLTSGLIEEAKSADELAGVLAHEMGHGIALHPEAALVRAIGLAAATELILSGSSGTLGSLGSFLLQLRYSRDAEREADRIALDMLRAASISSKPLSDFFTRLQPDEEDKENAGDQQNSNTSRTGRRVIEVLSSHPPSPERARQAAEQGFYPSRPAMSDADWQALRKICG